MRTEAELEATARRNGMTVAAVERVPSAAGTVVASRLVFEDPWDAARLLADLSEEDAADPWVRAWSLAILQATAEQLGQDASGPTISPELLGAYARALFGNVQTQIRFVEEPQETFQSARVTMMTGAGDCDDHARLLYALARAGGVDARLLFFPEDDEPVHVVSILKDAEGWHWAETTVDAVFGEEPFDAADRLGIGGQGSPFVAMGAASTALFVTPGDVLAYRQTWDGYVTGVARALKLCAQKQTDPADVRSLEVDAGALMQLWNLYAGWTESEIVLEASSILESFQETAMRAIDTYAAEVRRVCPAMALPAIPSTDLQAQVIGRIEGLGILAHGVLQLLGMGAGGALEVLGPIVKAPGNPDTWSTLKSLAWASAVIAGSLAVRELVRARR